MVLWIVLAVVVFSYSVFPVLWTRTIRKASFYKTGRSGTVSLTFDDGPNPHYTPRLLDVLHDCGVRATFFVLMEQANRYPDIVERMLREGHDVQVHGFKHWFVPILPPFVTRTQCIEAKHALEARFNTHCLVYRPTWGACNLATLWWLHKAGMKLCTWSVMVGDWRRLEAQELILRIEKKICDEAIIVLHDSDWTPGAEHEAPEAVIQAIPTLVQKIQARGLQLVRISDCL